MANRTILRIATPVTLDRLRKVLAAYEGDESLKDAVVLHYNGSLRIEAPEETLPLNGSTEA